MKHQKIRSNKECSFKMCSNFTCYLLKIDQYTYRQIYASLMTTTKQKSLVDTQKIMRMESKHNPKKSHQTTRKESRRRRKEKRETTKQPDSK